MPFYERTQSATALRLWKTSIDATYLYTAGIAGDPFFAALRDEGKLTATACSACAVEYLPPRAFCELCFADLSASWHEVAPEGVIAGLTVMRIDIDGKRLVQPELRALVRLGRGTGGLIHRVLARPGEVKIGDRVRLKVKPRAQREGRITDIEGFTPINGR